MPDFTAKMHQKSISAGAPPQAPLGELTALPRPPSLIWGPTSKGRGGEGRGWKGREKREELTGKGREREGGRKGKGEDDCYSVLFRP